MHLLRLPDSFMDLRNGTPRDYGTRSPPGWHGRFIMLDENSCKLESALANLLEPDPLYRKS